jgi:CheY-like chemotaxis protein
MNSSVKPCRNVEPLNNDYVSLIMAQEKVLIVEGRRQRANWPGRTDLGPGVTAPHTARDGAEGFDRVAAFLPAIVLTDMKMPRMSGWSYWKS